MDVYVIEGRELEQVLQALTCDPDRKPYKLSIFWA